MKLQRRIAQILATCLVLLAGAWTTGVLFYRFPATQLSRDILAAASILASLLVVWSIWHERWNATAAFSAVVVTVGLCWNTISPSSSRGWAADVSRMAWAVTNDGRVTLHNVRNFGWRTDRDFIERWEDRSYDLSQLKTVDGFLSYWNGETIAHTILSFGFKT